MTVRVALIGDGDRAEMRPIADWLAQQTAGAELHRAGSIKEFLAHQVNKRPADLIVLLESQPDDYTAADVSALFAAAPIGRIVCCAGAWSESAGRTRKTWPLALRVPAVSAIARLEREWRHVLNQSQEIPLPPTASREEWFAAHHPGLPEGPRNGKRVLVVSPDAAYRQWLVDCLATAGCAVMDDIRSACDVLLWDVDPWSATRQDDLRRQMAASAPTTVIAVSGWVTPELTDELVNAGVGTVLPKLGDHHRLIAAIATA